MNKHSARPVNAGDHLYLIDGSGYIFRAYHALPPLTRKSDGLPVGAVQGFCNMLYKLLKQMSAEDRPTHLAVIFDKSSKSFRNEIYPQYKAQRPDAPADLVPQFGLIRQATVAFNVACIEQDNYEADDLIATYARQAEAAGATVRIVSSDKDLMQLVSDKVALYDTMKDKEIGRDEVIEKFGVPPEKVIEVQALAGNSVDNIPGVPGIGVKTGAQLIEEYGDLETLLARAGEIKQPKRREKLIEFADQARVSRQLVTLKTDVPLDHQLDEFGVVEPDPKPLIGFLKALEFTSLTRRIAGDLDADANEIEPVEVTFKGWPPEGADVDELGAERQPSGDPASVSATLPAPAAGSADPAAGDAARTVAERIRAVPLDHSVYETVTSMDRLNEWIELIREVGHVAVDTETTSLDNMQAGLVGVSLSVEPGKACYIPVGHRASEGLDFGGNQLDQLKATVVLAALKQVLEHPGILKIGQNLKYDLTILARLGINVAPIDDTMLMSYALDSGLNGHGMDELAETHLGLKPVSFKEVAGSGKSQVTFDLVPIDKATAYAAEDADITLQAVARAETPSGGGTPRHRLRNAGASADTGAGGHGARGHSGGPHGAGAPVRRVRQGSRCAGGGGPQAGRRAVQSGLAQAAGRNPVRQDGTARRQEDRNRRMVNRQPGAGRAGGRGRGACPQAARLAPADQAALDLHGRADRPHQP